MLEREEGTGWAAAWFSLYLDINPQKKKKKDRGCWIREGV